MGPPRPNPPFPPGFKFRNYLRPRPPASSAGAPYRLQRLMPPPPASWRAPSVELPAAEDDPSTSAEETVPKALALEGREAPSDGDTKIPAVVEDIVTSNLEQAQSDVQPSSGAQHPVQRVRPRTRIIPWRCQSLAQHGPRNFSSSTQPALDVDLGLMDSITRLRKQATSDVQPSNGAQDPKHSVQPQMQAYAQMRVRSGSPPRRPPVIEPGIMDRIRKGKAPANDMLEIKKGKSHANDMIVTARMHMSPSGVTVSQDRLNIGGFARPNARNDARSLLLELCPDLDPSQLAALPPDFNMQDFLKPVVQPHQVGPAPLQPVGKHSPSRSRPSSSRGDVGMGNLRSPPAAPVVPNPSQPECEDLIGKGNASAGETVLAAGGHTNLSLDFGPFSPHFALVQAPVAKGSGDAICQKEEADKMAEKGMLNKVDNDFKKQLQAMCADMDPSQLEGLPTDINHEGFHGDMNLLVDFEAFIQAPATKGSGDAICKKEETHRMAEQGMLNKIDDNVKMQLLAVCPDMDPSQLVGLSSDFDLKAFLRDVAPSDSAVPPDRGNTSARQQLVAPNFDPARISKRFLSDAHSQLSDLQASGYWPQTHRPTGQPARGNLRPSSSTTSVSGAYIPAMAIMEGIPGTGTVRHVPKLGGLSYCSTELESLGRERKEAAGEVADEDASVSDDDEEGDDDEDASYTDEDEDWAPADKNYWYDEERIKWHYLTQVLPSDEKGESLGSTKDDKGESSGGTKDGKGESSGDK